MKKLLKTSAPKAGTKAFEIMTKPVESVHLHWSLRQVADLFNDKNISAAAVLDENRTPIGVITKTDLIRHIGKETVKECMTPVIFSVPPETLVSGIAQRMIRYGIHHIFVRAKNGGPIMGIVSSFDILKTVAGDRP